MEMETATDQEILEAAQARLMEKRKEREATKIPTLSIVSAPSEFKVPLCKHGNGMRECQECTQERENFWEKQEEERQENERLKIERIKQQRFEHPERWLRDYAVPKKYLEASFENFIGGEKAKEKCRQFPQKNIVLHGNTGCGKTHLAVAIIRELVQNETIKSIHKSGEWSMEDHGARFITVPNLLMEIRNSFKDKAEESESHIVDRFIEYPFLILDDLGADRATEWAIETLYLIIDGRDSSLKPTFITTNLSIPEIESHYGARIASRIAGMEIIKLDLPDYRKKRR